MFGMLWSYDLNTIKNKRLYFSRIPFYFISSIFCRILEAFTLFSSEEGAGSRLQGKLDKWLVSDTGAKRFNFILNGRLHNEESCPNCRCGGFVEEPNPEPEWEIEPVIGKLYREGDAPEIQQVRPRMKQ